jgi:hypothetical protein
MNTTSERDVEESQGGDPVGMAIVIEGPVVVFCGSRDWPRGIGPVEAMISWRIDKLPPVVTIVHGDARGADKMVDRIAREKGLQVIRVPAQWSLYGKGAGYVRNMHMLDSYRPVLVIAIWNRESKGTMHTINEAQKRQIATEVLDPYQLH